MDVYLVPVGQQRHELYCEVPDELTASGDAEPRTGFFQRLRGRFSDMLAEAERERRQGSPTRPSSWMGRLKARTLRWAAESIAEQRLLWHMRTQTCACLYYPDDMDQAAADRALREHLTRDRDRHRFWLIIDSTGFVASGALMLVPGPNLLAYYFAFRLVGHYLSMKGAARGLFAVSWRAERSAPLSELRAAIALAPDHRVRQVRAVALKLRLEHLVPFFERAAVTSS
jgi:hypothetical protein